MPRDKAWTPELDLTLHLGRGQGGSQGKGLHFLQSGMGKGILAVVLLQGVSSVFWQSSAMIKTLFGVLWAMAEEVSHPLCCEVPLVAHK